MAKLLEAGTPLGERVLLLRAMSGQEELGRLSEFQLEFVSQRGDIGAAEILGKNVSWLVRLGNGEPRYFNGFVTRFAEAGEGPLAAFDQDSKGHAYFYQASVHPWLWFLTRASNCRIFQNMTVLEIADKVFESYPFAHVKKVQLRSDYPTRDYNVQYRETDFNFVCRLFEQEGLYFTFEYDNGRNTLVLMDSYGAHKTVPALEVPYYPESTGDAPEDHITAWSVNREIQPGKYTIDDFNYLTPRDRMTGEGVQPKDHDLAEFEIYDYPGEYALPGEGTQYARTRIEELHARYEQFSGSGNVRLAAPGRLLKLQEHPRTQYNAEYLVTSVSYTASVGEFASGGAQADFHCGVAAIAASTPFRPARITPKPIIQGPQTAIVVGKAGEEIHTDDEGLGRIKVQFHWDRYSKTDENSSCWVRVAQPLAGSAWGFLALPRIGHEVVVEFLEGDPDHPLVTGSVYNEVLKPPYALPTEKTRSGLKTHSSKGGSSSNFNELRFEDKKGAEQIYIHAEKDKAVRIKHDRLEWVGNESHLIVKKDAFEKREADHHVSLKGDRNEKLDGSLSLNIGKDLLGKIGTKLAYDAGMEIHLKAGTNLVLESGTSLSLKVGGNFVSINPGGVFITGTMVMINSGGAAGTGSGASPQPPKDPKEAGTSKGGEMTPPPTKVPPSAYTPPAQMFVMAAASGTPFCEICNC